VTSALSKIGIIANPISGGGEALAVARTFEKELIAAGYEVHSTHSQPQYNRKQISSFLAQIQVLVICGGDGTVCGLLEHLANSPTAIYVVPTGVESLISKNFLMTTNAADLIEKIKLNSTSEHFVASVNGRPFFLMASVGLDSAVVFEIARTRSKKVGKIGYVKPLVKTFFKYNVPKLTVAVDGKEVISATKGFFIAGNTNSYAGGLKLVPEANSREQLLHARFYPFKSKAWYLKMLLHYLLKIPVSVKGSILLSGTEIKVSGESAADSPALVALQADGDFFCNLPATIRRENRKIKILAP